MLAINQGLSPGQQPPDNLKHNGATIHWVQHNRVNINDIYSNNSRICVFTTTLYLWMPNPASAAPINLRSFINARNPLNRKRIVIFNDKRQPTIQTGNLSGLEVEFINRSEIQGSYVGSNAFEITSSIRLINNGWIRGAGGNGAPGSRGADGMWGANSLDKPITWLSKHLIWGNDSKSFRVGKGNTVSGSFSGDGGWRFFGAPGVCWIGGACAGSLGYCGSGSACGSALSASHSYSGGLSRKENYTFFRGAGELKEYSDYTIPGAIGGRGGIGGAGGVRVGIGQSFSTTRTLGEKGKPGGWGWPGSQNFFDAPAPDGKRYLGNESGNGWPGAPGQNAGDGGTWGQRGGNNGTAAGRAITGRGRFLSGSKTGNVNGAVV